MRRGPFLFLFAVSGAAALIYEVVWTRLLTLQMGHGIAAASTVLAAFMGGLAIGAAIAGRRGGRLSPERALRVYAGLELTIGVLALLLPVALTAVRPLLVTAYADGQGGASFAFLRLATSVLLLALPAAAMGATFPIASRWTVRGASSAAQEAGGLYAANTLGAATGAVLAGFVLIPALGLNGATWVGVALNITAAAGLAIGMLMSAGLSLAAAASVDWALLTMAEIVARPGYQFSDVLSREVLLATGLLLPMTIAFGTAFPFAVALAAGRDEAVTESIGRIYAVNTIGAIAGALLAGFVLVPEIGLHVTIRVVAAIAGVAAVAVLMRAGQGRGRLAGFALAAVVLAGGIALPPWDRLLLSSGAYKYAAAMRGPGLETSLTAGELLSYREGATGTVAVRQLAGTVSLAIDGKVDASNAGDMLTQRLLAHIPLLLHPAPKRVAILGLGSGVTLGSALTHPLDAATVLEISPEVVDASRFFDAENHQALADPRTRLVVGDGRTHLMLGREQYDVIVSEPSNPWMAGIASLFTREFFEGAKARLAPGGVLCQWAHTYDISRDDLRSIVATFLTAFPDGTMWLVGDADVLLVGSTGPLDGRIAGIAEAWKRPGVADDLASVGARDSYAITSLFVAQGAALKAWATGAPLQTDDRMQLEFSGPRNIFGGSRDDNAVTLRDLASSSPKPAAVTAAEQAATAADHRNRGLMFLQSDAHRPAYEDFTRALAIEPNDPVALDGLTRSAAALSRIDEVRAALTKLASVPANSSAKLALSKVLASQGAVDEAVRIPFSLLQADPGNVPALEQLASVLSDVGDVARLEPVVAKLVAEAPKNTWAHYYAGSLFFMQSRLDLAAQAARHSISLDPTNAKAHNLLGACLASMGQTDAARSAFKASLKTDPREPGTYVNLATLELQAGNRTLAHRYFSEALTVDPASQAARDGLASMGPVR